MKDIHLKLNAPWQEVKEKLKEVNAGLTDEDLQYEPGKEMELIERLSGILKREPEHIKALIESISATRTIAS
jgi:hypothetical protein